MSPLPAWLKGKKFRVTLFVLAIMASPFLFLLEENWRGKHEYEFYKRKLEAQGEHLDFNWFLGPPIPDDKNFAMCPALTPLYDYTLDPVTGDRTYKDPTAIALTISINGRPSVSGPDFPKGSGGWQTGQMRDLDTWQKYYRTEFPKLDLTKSPPEDILAALAQYDAFLDLLRDADASRPLSRYPLKPVLPDPDVPRYSTFRGTVSVLALRSSAELRLGRADDALADVKLGFRIIESLRGTPLLIGGLVRVSLMAILMQPVWEGIASHQWTDPQLAQIEVMLQKNDFLADFGFSFRSERAWSAMTWNALRTDPRFGQNFANSISLGGGSVVSPMVKFMRFYTGITWQNEVYGFRLTQDSVLPLIDVKARRVDVPGTRALTAMKASYNPYKALARISLPVDASLVKKFAAAQTSVDEARIACEIERYRHAHGTFPAKLADLGMPAIPCDAIDGKPLRYLLLAPDDYRLYSIGWNETDDGGTIDRNSTYGSVNLNQGDWVWSLTPLK